LFGLSENLLWLTCLVTGALSAATVMLLGPAIARRRSTSADIEAIDTASSTP
jgi:hypothetical protein